jgi:chitodextrinase
MKSKSEFLPCPSSTRRRAPFIAPLAALALASILFSPARAAVGFSASLLGGLATTNTNKALKVTSLQFGPDNRLYFTQVNGTVIACEVTRLGPNNYVAANAETITLVKNIPNYDDDGTRNFSLNTRQATGILVVGTAVNPVIYVSSSDPREGAGSGATDLNLDTNSGIISRLTRNGSGVWEKVDIVRGLPRSEENHASNGLQIDPSGNTLYLAQGGNTNAGGPSNNFAFSCETALAAAVLSIDLTAIEAMPVKTDAYGQQYIYDIPTVDDPNPARANVTPANAEHADVNDPFGGNDGLNQARIVPGGPVQVHASGFRNPYDIVIAKTPGRAGKMYTFDNAGNSGWGGYPKNEAMLDGLGNSLATNEHQPTEPGAVNNLDNLHLITGAGYYGGHPNPIRANPAGAGWLRFDGSGPGLVYSVTPTVDWPPVPLSMANPVEGDFRLPGVANGSLFTNTSSTTGMVEFTAPNFEGEMVGNLIVTQYNNKTVQRLVMNADGTQVLSSSVLLSGDAYSLPLDVTVPGPEAAPALTGTIFVGHHSSKITVLEPSDFDSGNGGVCSGNFTFGEDEDGDGFSNADEISNATDPCSSAVLPPDRDGDFLSDLLDTDDDNDGIADSQDLFQIDPLDGVNVAPPMRYDLFNELNVGFFGIGFTGVMLNPGEDYRQRILEANLIAGGTAGLFTDPDVGAGNPHGSSNTQTNAFLFGVNVDEFTGPFRVRSGLGGLLFNGTPTASQSQGIFIGNGDQDNYVKVAVHANSGPGGIEVVHEENGTVISQIVHTAADLFTTNVTLSFLVDPIAGTVLPGYSIGTGPIVSVGSPIAVGGKILEVIRGSGSMAVGLLATTGNVLTPGFNATWDYFEVMPVTGTTAATVTVDSGSGSLNTSSTNSSGSFQIQNLSTGGQKITSVSIDLGTAMVSDLVFDPAGTAGDPAGKTFTLDSFNGTGSPVGTFASPKNGVDSQDGYSVVNVGFGPGVDFAPTQLLTFSADIDPTSVKGSAAPGPSHSASISGMELTGATATVTFDDGSVRKIRLAPIVGSDKGSRGVLSSATLPTPGIQVPGKISPFSTSTQPTVRVSGPPGHDVKLWVFNMALHLDGVPGGGYDIDPYESNTLLALNTIDRVMPAAGFVDIPVTLSDSGATGGINHLVAVLSDGAGNRSASSEVLTIDYDPDAVVANAVVRVNAGGGLFVDSLGQTWSADYGFSAGATTTETTPIEGTTDDTIYQSFRYNPSPTTPFKYSFLLPNGEYQVKLHFAEVWPGAFGPGLRVFDVLVGGSLAIDNLDVFAQAGANTAYSVTLPAQVTNGQLEVQLQHVVQNPMICGIEVFSSEFAGPDIEAPQPPGLLTATNVAAGSLTFVWAPSTDDRGVAGYRIRRDGVLLGTTTQLTFTDTGRTPSTSYLYTVEAFDATGNTSTASPITITTLADQENPTAPPTFKGTPGNALAILSWTAASDDAGIAGYRIYRDGLLIATLTGLSYTDSGLTNTQLYAYEIEAFDAAGKISPRVATSVRPRALAGAVLRVNAGGPVYTDLAGNVWQADYGFNTGVVEVSTGAIAHTDDDALYQARRFDRDSGAELKYTFPLADGEYELRLHFAEVWSGASTAPGIRVFDVKVEDQLALDNFDIYAEALAQKGSGFATAVAVPIPVTVTGGNLTIEFIHQIQNPTIAAIEVFALQGPPPDTFPPSMPGGLAVTGTTPGSVSLAWNAATDEVGVTGYRIRRNGSTVTEVAGLSFSDTGLAANTPYTYAVAARDAAGNYSPETTVATSTLPDTTPPSTPGSLSGTPGSGVAVLSWTASTDDGSVTGYEIWRDAALLTTVSSTNYTDAGLTNGTTYAYQVIAVDAANNKSAPASTSVTPRALGPALLRVNAGSIATHVDLAGNTWVPDFGYSSSSMEASTGAIFGTDNPTIYQTRRFIRSSRPNLSYQFSVPNGDYEVRLHFAEVWSTAFAPGVRVFDVSVEGALKLDNFDIFSAAGANTAYVAKIPTTVNDGTLNLLFDRVVQNPTISAIEVYPVLPSGPADTEAPTAPGNLAATSVTTDSVALEWIGSTDNTAVIGYRVFRGASEIATVNGLTFSESGLPSGASLNYSVVAFDAAGNESVPAQVAVTTLVPDTQAPTAPGGLAATPGLSHIALSWTAATDNIGVTSYRILKNGNLLTTVNQLTFTDSGLPSNTEADYEVFALDAVGNVSSPAQITVSTLADTEAPSVPANLSAIPGYVTVGLSWSGSSDNAGVTGYRIYRDNVLRFTTADTAFGDTGLVPGQEYDYEVSAIDSANNESARAPLTVSTVADTENPTMPPGIQATPGDGRIVLSWAPSNDNVTVAHYQIHRNGSPLTTVTTPGFTDLNLVNGVPCFYQVRAVDEVGNQSAPALVSATPRVLGNVVTRVNAGGLGFTDLAGNTWYDDQGFSTGNTLGSGNPIAGTGDDVLYQSERYDSSPSGANLEYSFAVPAGEYEVILHFAETYSGITGPGQRVFDVAAEGTVAIDDLDIFARVGANTALAVAFPVVVTDGNLDLEFLHGVQNPKVCGIEVHEIVDIIDPSSPTGLATSNITTTSVDLSWTAATDNIGVTGYRILRGAVEIGDVVAPPFTASALASGTEHVFSVVAYDAEGNESAPAVVNATTLVPDTVAPGAPLNLGATPATTSVTLLWQAPTDNVAVTGYRVVRGVDTLADNLAALTWTETGLASGSEFTYQVFALDAAGNVSSAATVTTTTLVPPTPFEQWLINNGLTGQTTGDSDGGSMDNLSEFELQMNPNDPADDLTFRLDCEVTPGGSTITFPVLKPLGNYHLHRDNDLAGIGNIGNRIHTVTKAQIEAMTPEQRASHSVADLAGGTRAFYQLIFEPVAD